MRNLSSLILFLVFAVHLGAQNPHGADLKINCAACHTSAGWEINAAFWEKTELVKPKVSKTTGIPIPVDTALFRHSKTAFPLTGRHATVDCRGCHESLVFSKTQSECLSCHLDMHQQTVGTDCARCHTTSNWMVDNVTDLHVQNGFPLAGAHQAVSCNQCHTSASTLQFNRIGNDCLNCHRSDFEAATNPNHKEAGFSTNCSECHDATKTGWGTDRVNHDFFPLTKGHEVADCKKCHTGGAFSSTPNTCFACHQADFETTQSPNHVSARFSNDCAQCHTTDPDWMPAVFGQHDAAYFPIYSGKHKGQWNACIDCHTDPANYATFTCTTCHANPATDNEHVGVNGYVYTNDACLACHPTGDAAVVFDHNTTNFPLTGAHLSANCTECHASGFAGTPTQCSACHTPDYNNSANPSHTALNLPTDCAQCHTTAPGWAPASFNIHNNYYILKGSHAAIANDCAACHNGNYNNTPNTCNGCHNADYNQTTNPNHAAQQLPTECTVCHSESAWAPSTFDHNTVFPFTGAHIPIASDCNQCHQGNYTNTPNTCNACHTPDYNSSANPSHTVLNLPTDCAQCHTTAPGWEPATFPIHNNFYALNGAHAAIANDCAQCHNGNYNNTPNTCNGCHNADYNQTTDPNHAAQKIPADCASCHTESAWTPSNFKHDAQYFPIYSGKHNGEWTTCTDCHTNPSNYAEFTCITCHTNPETDNQHTGVGGYTYNSDACLACHPTGDGDVVFDHNTTKFPLTGAHQSANCLDCHATGFTGTPTQCNACHAPDYNNSANPSHTALNLPTDCAECHTTAPGWAPASFPIHNNFYALNGAHAAIANDCATCHNGNYNNTPNTCNGCHNTDYNQTTAPNHAAQQIPTNCTQCHSESAWAPSTFDHNAVFPFTGAHLPIANDCNRCHQGNYTNTPNTCNACHTNDYNNSANPSHTALNLPTDCAMCHTTAPGWEPATFPIHNNLYPLNEAHANIANDCAACHHGNYNSTPNTCNGCHSADYNQTTLPNHAAQQLPTDCAACHSESAWAPSTFDHNAVFPFTGAHLPIANDCNRCHQGNYTNTPNTCNACHTNDYNNSANPSHTALNLPTDCAQCHTTAPGWEPATFAIHNNFYTLNGAHAAIANDCAACHNGNYNNTPNTCNGCHTTDYAQTTNPNHAAQQIPTDCASCHTESAWTPTNFNHDALHFPIYSGKHNGEWTTCTDCHTNPSNYTEFTCITCHTNPETNNQHTGVGGYTYNSNACLACHPTGDADVVFDHNTTNFPLTGAHQSANCLECHATGFAGTPTQCNACHTTDYNNSANPSHTALNLPTDCAQCHTTAPGWEPATFPIHNNFYALNGAHAAIANDCAQCHNGNYNNTPNTCNGCHNGDYAQTTTPNHVALKFSTDCASCHTESVWTPSTFNHDVQYFPIYSGKHDGEWSTCTDCHTNPSNYTEFTCVTCHTNPETNNQHVGVGGYIYNSNACLACHPTGDADVVFDHNTTNFPLTGAHLSANCLECHATGFVGTPTQCNACHTPDYNASANPSHTALNLPTDCAQCHTTAPGWEPATFAIHNNYYALNGAHAAIANNCATCHNGNYNNTPNTCNGCHNTDYNQTTTPNHAAQQIPTDCAQCHAESAWTPSTFDHNTVYPFVGAHIPIANDCNRCHQGNYTNTPNTCNGCHSTDYNQTTNPNHAAQQFPTDCATCHTQSAWTPSTFDHNAVYPFTGAHIPIANDCNLCHQGNYTNTPNTCNGCHNTDYNASANPSHTALNLPTNCAQCHTTAPGWEPAAFPIHNNFYTLVGAHAAIANDCAACHNGNYNNTPNTCNGCHSADYNQTTNPNHATQQFPTDCATCHTQSAWTPSTFDHNAVYPFTGAHIPIANDCNLCHQGNYTNTPNTCNGCHNTDYNASANPSHTALNLPTDCAQCHTTAPGWEPATFPLHNNFYTLVGAHAAIANDCAACHNGNYNNTPNTCNGCHSADYNQTTNPNHATQQFPTDCATCHTQSAWTPSTFDHNAVYPFTGAHIPIANDCNLCHQGNYTNTPNTCNGCHNTDYNASANPSHTALNLPTNCAQCHTTAPGWEPATFPLHNNFYTLVGAHAAIANDCAACHNGNYNNTPNTCNGCHSADYNQTSNPNHATQQFPTDCATCHTQSAWTPSTFDHNAVYPFTGAHIPIANDCNLCHQGNYTNTPNTCNGCHNTDYTASANPSHTALNLPTDCAQCHTTAPGWEPATFPIHNNFYTLVGAHAAIANDCAACHNGNYNNTPNTCNSCHSADYNQTTNPNHAAQQLPTDCTQCHSQSAWVPSTFNHNTVYPFTGAHIPIANDCNLCHQGNYTNTPNTCNGCHSTDYTASANPSHTALNLPTDCAQCHTTAPGWEPATFPIHNNFYTLVGAHAAIANDCAACHNGNYNNTPNTCNGCHNADYNQTTDPNHAAQQLPTDCTQCHSQSAWTPATFDHNSVYPFVGAHIPLANQCNLCHNGNYTNTPNTCNGCHSTDYNQTTNPNHAAQQLPTDCTLCHSQSAWVPSTFNHNTVYPFTGAHIPIANDCNLCHQGNYTNTPNTCNGCHNTDYTASANPSHTALNLPTDCAQCHTTAPGWEPAAFPNHNNFYALVGAHAAIANDCAACHNGNYNNTPNTCNGCHSADYNQTTNPNHAAQQFSTDCTICHSQSAWTPSTFDHNAVYPFVGAHIPIANQCNLCHNGNYTNTPNTCNGCHSADYNQTTNPNHAAQQLPTDCTQCHSQSAWVPSTFNHNTVYPFTGAHITIANDCNLCHQGNYTNTPNTCNGCHNTDYTASANPSHTALNLPTDCAQCHTTAPGWEPAAFPIHNNFYTLVGAHAAIANDCAACHNGNYNNTPNTCNGCHSADYNQTTNPNHAAQQLPTDCTLCHSQSAWVPSTFNHNTVYPFTGAHIPIANDCNLCHQGNYTNTPNNCNGCHNTDYTASANPSHTALNLPTDCAQCHTTAPGWEPAAFPNHNNFYALVGAHAAIANDCAACHNGNYNNTPNTCNGCHSADYNQTTNPNHAAQQFSTDCTICHSQSAWTPSTFDHNAVYPFVGAHIPIANQCNLCHNGNYTNTPNTCNGCHNTDYNQTTNPNHAAQQLPTDCTQCHSQSAWVPSTFNHNTVYPFTGAHIPIANDCNLCHQGNYTNTPNTCNGCHNTDYTASANPSHTALNLPTDCAQCHTTSPGWEPAAFPIHNNFYTLVGAHAAIANDCAACHNGNYNNTPNTCNGCHSADYNQTTNPNHAAQQLPTDCTLCHSQSAWVPSTFNHNTVYPFTGAHIPIANDCNLCHQGNYTNTPNTCNGCHNTDYTASANPSHTALNLPTDCAQCHTTAPGWEPATFPNHNNFYALVGAHAAIANDCATCHNGNYNNTPNTCNGCHSTDYNQTTNPNHPAEQLPTDCTLCHSQSAWVPSTFNHNTVYPFTGAHIPIANDCNLCHQGNYTNTPNTCNGCHNPDYNASANPSHTALNLPTNCAQCHTTDPDWNPATFPIHNNYYALNGAHAAIANDCAACHNGNYNNTPNTCYGCHAADYNGANNPNHSAAGFPTTCQNCHTESAWTPSTFDHDNMYFPIYSGKHKDEWNQCIECHTNANNFTLFSCIDCHEHDDPVDMADKHQGVSGYSYNSAACYSCHPDGKK